MLFIKLLFSSLIYMTAMTITNPTNDEESNVMWRNALNYNLSNTILPSHYLIRIVFRPDLSYLTSKYVITIHILFATQHIHFYLSNSWNISNTGLRQVCSKMEYKIKLPIYRGKNNVVMFDFDEFLVPGIYLLKMDLIHYNFETNSSKILFIKKGEDMWLMTDIQTKKQHIFPYWNNPELRIRFNISIMHHGRYTVLSNMPIQMFKPTLNNMMWSYFHTTPLMTIDSVALVITSYPITNVINYKTVNMLYRSQLKSEEMAFSLYLIENITRYLQNNSMWVFEKTYDSFEKKVDHVAILDLNDEVKPKLGFVFYRDADIVYNENLDTTACQMRIAHLIARGMVQKYMNNLLSPSYWFDQWLNEGFKIYMETYIIEKVLPNFRMMDLFVVQVQHELLHLNTYVVINSVMDYCIYSEKYIYSSLSHVKGSIIWRMLELILSPDIFSKCIDIYLNNRFREANATTSNHLWNAMQSVMNALNYKLEFNIKTMIDSWATQRYPFVLEVMRNYSSNASIISIRFHNKLKEEQYYIPVTYTTKSELNFAITWTNITWVTPGHYQEIKFILAEDQWIIFNLQQVGYYRVYYDTESWKNIGRYLNSYKYKNIHVLNRAQIVDDAFHFAVEKKLNFGLFCKIAKYLLRERDYIAWYPMIKALEFMSNFFAFSDYNPQFEKVKIKRMKFLTLWNVFGKHNDHIERLNQEVAKWKCIVDVVSCKTLAHVRLQEHLKNPKKNKLSPGWKRWTYCNGLKFANNKTWNQVISNMKKIDPMILECLAYVKDRRILMHYLQTQLFDFMSYISNRSKPPERPYALAAHILLFTLARNTNILNHILDNFESIVVGRVNEIAAIIVIINNVYSMKQLDEMKNFIRREYHLSFFEYYVERKIKIRWSEIQRQMEFFHSFIN